MAKPCRFIGRVQHFWIFRSSTTRKASASDEAGTATQTGRHNRLYNVDILNKYEKHYNVLPCKHRRWATPMLEIVRQNWVFHGMEYNI